MKKLLFCIALVSFVPKQEKDITVSMPIEGWQYVIDVLKKQPYENSAGVIGTIVQQVTTKPPVQQSNPDSTAKKKTKNQ